MAAKRSPSLQWDDLRLLLAVARTGSFLAAGRGLGLATSTLSRRIARLESAVREPLLERRSDGVRLTASGARLAETAGELDLAVRARVRDLPAGRRELEGTIRLTAGDGFTGFAVDAVAAFRAVHPRVAFELVIDAHPLDLVRREADVAIRTGHGRESSLIYRTLGELPYSLWASQGYVARRGSPRRSGDVSNHDWLGLGTPLDRTPAMRWLRSLGIDRFALLATSFGTLLAAAKAGLGVTALPDRFAAGLVRVMPRARPAPLAVYWVTHPDARRLPHVRAFGDLVVDRFARSTGTADPAHAPSG
jgi:DNA-binding transcriptional LysR family regulator